MVSWIYPAEYSVDNEDDEVMDHIEAKTYITEID